MNFNQTHLRLLAATAAEQIFEHVHDAAALQREFRSLSKTVHPDHNPSNRADAEAAFRLLTAWQERADAKMRNGAWGDGEPHVVRIVTTLTGTYRVHHLLRREALVDAVAATLDGSQVELHIPRALRNSTCEPRAEAASLSRLPGVFSPVLIETLRVGYRTVCATDRPPLLAKPVREWALRFPDGVPLRHALVYIDGLLAALKGASQRGLVHGSINPATCWVTPTPYRHYLIDWHYSVPIGGVVTHVNDTYREFCSWEVLDRKPVDLGTDLTSAMKLLQWLVGGQDAPIALQGVIVAHLREGRARPTDVDACRRKLQAILAEL